MKLVVFDEAAEPTTRLFTGNMTEMYNISNDDAEMNNIAVTDPAGSRRTFLALQQRLDHLRTCKEGTCRD
jgi:hypothetical protein